MNKKLISLVAIAAMLCGPSLVFAGSVTTSGNTNISIGGFIQNYFIWSNNGGALGYIANPEYTAPNTPNTAQTKFNTTAQWSDLKLGLSNPTEGIKGSIEGDFWGGGANQGLDSSTGNFRLTHAYFVKQFCQGNCSFKPWLLIGQDWDPMMRGELGGFSLNSINLIAGGAGSEGQIYASQVGFGVKFDLGTISLNPAIYAASIPNDIDLSNSDVINSSNTALTDRFTMPAFVFTLPLTFETGLGGPATVIPVVGYQNLKVSGTGTNYNYNSKNENSYFMGISLNLPIDFLTLYGNVHYERGFTGYDYAVGSNSGPDYTMPSYYIDSNGGINVVRATAWTAQAQIDLSSISQIPATIAGGYGQILFDHYGDLANNTNMPLARKYSTIYANVDYNLTKSLSLGVEYQHQMTYYVGVGNDGSSAQHANEVFLVGQYNF